MQHFWMLHDVLVVWPGSCNLRVSMLNSQHVAARRNRVTKRVQHIALNNVAICCVEMLRSFGRSLQILGQQCWVMLSCDVAKV